MRCARHEYVVDAVEWRAKQDAVPPVMFETEAEALAHFLQDYGAGLDMMKDFLSDRDRDSDDENPETRH